MTKLAESALGAGLHASELVPLRSLAFAINKLAPYMGVSAYVVPRTKRVVVFTEGHWYQFGVEQFRRPELLYSTTALAYAIVQSVPELRDRMGRLG